MAPSVVSAVKFGATEFMRSDISVLSFARAVAGRRRILAVVGLIPTIIIAQARCKT
jgi:hypothetical protein